MNQFATGESTGTLLFNVGAIWASVVNAALHPHHPGKETHTHCTVVWWAPGSVYMGAENVAPHQDSINGLSRP
jgi:hypothetical protein